MVTLTVEFLYAKEMKLPSGVCMKDGIHFLQNCGFHSLHTPLPPAGLGGSCSRKRASAYLLTLRFCFVCSIWRGPNVNCTDSSGYTALHHAALNGHK